MAGDGISLDKAEILAIFLETFFYGIYFTLFCITLYVLFTKYNGSSSVSRPLVITSFIMMFLATGHIIIDFVRIIEAFITRNNLAEGGPTGYYSELSNPLHVMKTAFYVTQTLTGDSVAAWRCFIIHGRKWVVVIFPILLLIGSAVTGYVVTWVLSSALPGSTIFDTGSAWITCFFVITLSMNLYCTGMTVYPIWSSRKAVGKSQQYSLTPVLLAIVESSALYSSALLTLLITYLSGSNGQYPALDIVTPLVGIVYSLIIIQINVWVAERSNNAISGRTTNFIQRRMRQPVNAFPLSAVSVEVTQTVHADRFDVETLTPAPTISSSKKISESV